MLVDPKDHCHIKMSLNSFTDLTDQEFNKFYLIPSSFFNGEKPISIVNLEEVNPQQQFNSLNLSVNNIIQDII